MAAALLLRRLAAPTLANGGLVRLSGSRRASALPSALDRLNEVVAGELESIKAAGTWKSERVITSQQQAQIRLKGGDGEVLNFCANNYLGLSSHAEVVAAAAAALQSHGAGLSSVRFICGTQDLHEELEASISNFHGREATILYPSCFDANAGFFEALLGADDAIISDELNHASIIDGIRLCRARKLRYRHLDLEDLDRKLEETRECRLRVVATDGVFSMDGEVAPLDRLGEVAERQGALLFVDECHGTGVVGETGRGTEELLGVPGCAHIINSTLGKALGGAAGGYTTGPAALVSLLRQRSRPYLFSNSLPPPVVAAARAAVRLLCGAEGARLCAQLHRNTQRFRSLMLGAGFKVGGANHPICPIMLGDAHLATVMADDILRQGVFVVGFSYPVVPRDRARIRVQISAAHSETNIDRCVEAFVTAGRRHGVVS